MSMIGQDELLNHINSMIEEDTFPKFSVIKGGRKSGKKTLLKLIVNKLNAEFVEVGKDIDSIRGMIDFVYRKSGKVVYYIKDFENAHVNAIDSLLKVFEEPPKDAYFIVTVTYNVPETIMNRSTVFNIRRYTPDDILKYVKSNGIEVNEEVGSFIYSLVRSIGEFKEIMGLNVLDLRNYVNIVLDNIGNSSIGNTLKISSKINFKDEADKFNLLYFLRCLKLGCFERQIRNANDLRYRNVFFMVNEAEKEMEINSINKQFIFDYLILEIRNELRT